jgi:hypothetical protein
MQQILFISMVESAQLLAHLEHFYPQEAAFLVILQSIVLHVQRLQTFA